MRIEIECLNVRMFYAFFREFDLKRNFISAILQHCDERKAYMILLDVLNRTNDQIEKNLERLPEDKSLREVWAG